MEIIAPLDWPANIATVPDPGATGFGANVVTGSETVEPPPPPQDDAAERTTKAKPSAHCHGRANRWFMIGSLWSRTGPRVVRRDIGKIVAIDRPGLIDVGGRKIP